MISPSWHPSRRELRQFGVAALLIFGALGALLRFQWGFETAAWVVWGLGLTCGVVGWFTPYKSYPLYLAIMIVTLPIGLVVSNLVLGILYYGVLTPMALVLRLTGRDPLLLRKPDTPSFWRPRTAQPEPKSYYRQS